MGEKMRYFTAAFTMLLILGTAALRADNGFRLPDTDLKFSEKYATAVLKFPLLDRRPGKIPVLKARIFYEKGKNGGGSYTVSLFLNVHKMSVKTYGGKNRLLRLSPPTDAKGKADGRTALWYRGGWFVMNGSGSGKTDDRILKTADGGWVYFFDISDLVKYTNTDSEIRENHFQIASYKKLPLKLRDMEIIYLTETQADQMRKQ